MVRDDADKPTTGYALQVAIFGSCVVAAVMLFVAFDLGSSTFMMDVEESIVGRPKSGSRRRLRSSLSASWAIKPSSSRLYWRCVSVDCACSRARRRRWRR